MPSVPLGTRAKWLFPSCQSSELPVVSDTKLGFSKPWKYPVSTASGIGYVTTAEQRPESLVTVILAGTKVKFGAILSITVMVCRQMFVLLAASTAIQVR